MVKMRGGAWLSSSSATGFDSSERDVDEAESSIEDRAGAVPLDGDMLEDGTDFVLRVVLSRRGSV